MRKLTAFEKQCLRHLPDIHERFRQEEPDSVFGDAPGSTSIKFDSNGRVQRLKKATINRPHGRQ